MPKGRSPFYRNRLRGQERLAVGPKRPPPQDTGYRKRHETFRACATCGTTKERVFLTRGVRDDGTLVVFTFCTDAHLAQWRTLNPWEVLDAALV